MKLEIKITIFFVICFSMMLVGCGDPASPVDAPAYIASRNITIVAVPLNYYSINEGSVTFANGDRFTTNTTTDGNREVILTISHDGDSDMTISSMTISGDEPSIFDNENTFVISNIPTVIASGETVNLTLNINRSSSATQNNDVQYAKLTIISDNPNDDQYILNLLAWAKGVN